MNQKGTALIKHAKIHDGLGNVFPSADLYIADGKIAGFASCLSEEKLKPDQVIEAAGLEIFPGFISVLGGFGGIGPGMNDYHLCEASSPITPQMNVKYIFMVDSMTSAQLYRSGITSSCLAPDFSNLFGGLAAVYKTYGTKADEMLIKEKAAQIASLSDLVKLTHAGRAGMNTTMGMLDTFVKTLKEGKDLKDVLSGKTQLILYTDSRSKYELLKAELQAFPDVKYAIYGIYDLAEEKDPEIAEGEQCAILGSIADSDGHFGMAIDYHGLNEMIENGCKIAISANFIPPDMMHREGLLWNANVFYQRGVSSENVLQMITSIPAELLGIKDRVGSLEIGKEADFTIWTANPITSFTAGLKHVWIDGREISLEEKVRVCW